MINPDFSAYIVNGIYYVHNKDTDLAKYAIEKTVDEFINGNSSNKLLIAEKIRSEIREKELSEKFQKQNTEKENSRGGLKKHKI